jgi:plasmid stability protein
MRSLTISIDDELHRATRIEAAKAGKSMSRYVADKLRETHKQPEFKKNPQKEAYLRILDGPALHVAIDGKMPTADERNER